MASTSDLVATSDMQSAKAAKKRKLMLTFIALLFVGLCNKVFIKLATIPLYNYPVFLNAISSFIYIPTSFAYIVPMAITGRFSKQELEIPQLVFLTIGALDALAGLMQLFATTFIKSGSLLVLLQQASIPLSMVISRLVLSARYTRAQYAGAAIVIVGIVVILLPSFGGGAGGADGGCDSLQCSPLVWSGVLVLSCVPMCLSTVYKERALAAVDCDPVLLNGWVAVWQFLISLPLSVPAAPVSGVAVSQLPANLANGWSCFVGTDSVTAAESALSGRPVDHCWPGGFAFTSLYLVFNQLFNLLIVLMLKFGSANLLYLAMTLLVPLGNIAFALPFMPGAAPLTAINFVGLAIIMSGLFTYRFADRLRARAQLAVPGGAAAAQPGGEAGGEAGIAQASRAQLVMSSPSGIFAVESFQALLDAHHIPPIPGLSRDRSLPGGDESEEDSGHSHGHGGRMRRTTGFAPRARSALSLSASVLRLDLGLQDVDPFKESLLRSDTSALFFGDHSSSR